MRDVILAATGAVADETAVPGLEAPEPTHASETAALREAAARSAGGHQGPSVRLSDNSRRTQSRIHRCGHRSRTWKLPPRVLAVLSGTTSFPMPSPAITAIL